METPASAPPHSAVTTASTAASVPISTPSTATTTVSLPPPPHHPYPDSMDSSPRSRNADSTSAPAPGWDPVTSAANTAGVDAAFQAVPGGAKLRLMCSYGGHIVPRPHDKSLCYVGGDTRIVVVDRNCTLEELLSRLSKMLLNGRPFTLKYQLPSEDLDSLITVSSEEDLDNMVDEYDRLVTNSNPAKPSRIRLFLFPTKLEVASSMGPILEGSVNKSEDWFLNALNGAGILQRGFSDPASVNCLLGLEENVGANNSPRNSDPNLKEGEVQGVGGGVDGSGNGGLGGGKTKLGNQSNQDVHSVPDSPIIETTSSFGSTSSSPSLANLPPIRVHVEDGTGNMPGGGLGARVLDHRVGIEDQFAQMSVGLQKQDEGVAAAMTSQAPLPLNPAISGGVVPVVSGGEYVNAIPRVVSDDERSDHGGYRKPPQLQPVLIPTSLPQQRSDLPSPDSVSSDSSLSNANNNRQKPVMYQDLSGAQIAAGGSRMAVNQIVTDPASRVQLQQVSDSGYLLPAQYEQIQQQSIQAQQQQHSIQAQQQQHSIQAQQQQHSIQAQQQQHSIQAQHQQQQSQQPSQTQQQQFIHAGTHYVQHHPAAGGVPISYYPVYPPQQTHPHHHPGQMDQRYPVYYISAGQGQAYSIPIQQPTNVTESTTVVPTSRPQTPPQNPSLMTSAGYGTSRTVSASTNPKPADMAQASVYRTSTVGGNPPLPQLVRMATPQQIQHQHHQHQVQQQQQQQQQQQPTAQQFVGYSQMPHHPSQSIAQASAANATYAYEYSDPAQSQRYFTQPLGPNMGAQYQTMVAPTMLMADGSAPNPNDNNAKQQQQQQQNRTSQAL